MPARAALVRSGRETNDVPAAGATDESVGRRFDCTFSLGNYSWQAIETVQSTTFKAWLTGLRDRAGARRIAIRIERLAMGNRGDHHGVGGGVMELRLTFGPGYRVYYKVQGTTLIVLLAGGDKSTQSEDIAKAIAVAAEWESENG